MWNNPIHVLAITEIRNNGGDDSFWLLRGDQKKIGFCLCCFQLPGIGAKCRKWRWQQKDFRDLRVAERNHMKTWSCNAFIYPVCSARVCVWVFMERLEFGPHGVFFGHGPRKVGFVLVLLWHSGPFEVNIPEDWQFRSGSAWMRQRQKTGNCVKVDGPVPPCPPPPHPPPHSS